MVVYATDNLYETLKAESVAEAVSDATPYQKLESMDEKNDGGFYPIFLINDKYGGRGLNFRAKGNSHGITLFVFGSVLDEKTFV